MRFFNAIYTLTDVVADNIAKGTQSFIENLLKLESRNANTEMTDKEKISEDFRRIGEDMYIALDKYEAKHGY